MGPSALLRKAGPRCARCGLRRHERTFGGRAKEWGRAEGVKDEGPQLVLQLQKPMPPTRFSSGTNMLPELMPSTRSDGCTRINSAPAAVVLALSGLRGAKDLAVAPLRGAGSASRTAAAVRQKRCAAALRASVLLVAPSLHTGRRSVGSRTCLLAI